MSDQFNQEQLNELQKQTAVHDVLIDKLTQQVAENTASMKSSHYRLDEISDAVKAAPTKDDIQNIIESSFNSQVVKVLKTIIATFCLGLVGATAAWFAKLWGASS